MTEIVVGSRSVGKIVCDGDAVAGEGGPVDARLVLPLSVRLSRRRIAEQIAVLALHCTMHVGDASSPTSPASQVGIQVDPRSQNQPFVSLPDAGADYPVDLRLPLSQDVIEHLERRRHHDAERSFTAVLRIWPEVAWVHSVGNSFGRPGVTEPNPLAHPFDPQVGMLCLYAHFWSVSPTFVPVKVSESAWVKRVLPGLGLNQRRLIEVSLPASGGVLSASVIQFFDNARRDFDAGRYRECIEKCRDVRNAIEQHLGATTQDRTVAKVIGERLRWSASASQRAYLKSAWKGLADLTNAGHHIGGAQQLTENDARTCLVTTAALCEYLSGLLSPTRRAP